MSMVPRCTVCDDRIDAYGRGGTRCSRCNEPCPTCQKDVACCPHPLVEAVPFVRIVRDTDPRTGRERVAA